jgi:hypothetical protein
MHILACEYVCILLKQNACNTYTCAYNDNRCFNNRYFGNRHFIQVCVNVYMHCPHYQSVAHMFFSLMRVCMYVCMYVCVRMYLRHVMGGDFPI